MPALILTAPPGYRVERRRGAVVLARPDAVAFARAALDEEGTLFEHAAARPDARRLESGRGPLYIVPVAAPADEPGAPRADTSGAAPTREPPEQGPAGWVVRHARRGGALARWTRDVYVRVGKPRPFRELLVSEAARERGIPTPRVVAAAVYPVGGRRYRGDVATCLVPGAADLARIVFGGEGPVPVAAAEAAGRLTRVIHERGLVHPDLNLANFLVETPVGAARPRAWLLDLDGCRLGPGPVGDAARRGMLKRFERSWRKWERRTGRSAPDALAAFRRGYAEAPVGGGEGA